MVHRTKQGEAALRRPLQVQRLPAAMAAAGPPMMTATTRPAVMMAVAAATHVSTAVTMAMAALHEHHIAVDLDI